MKRKHINRIRPDLKATVSIGNERLEHIIIERKISSGERAEILLEADEWWEIKDWVLALMLLSEQHNITP